MRAWLQPLAAEVRLRPLGRLRWIALSLAACAPPQEAARLGDVRLESGATLFDCRLGYRTFGKLDAARSNAVLLAPWTMATSRDLARQLGPGGLVDSDRYFVIAVDALANGVSSSPSNSERQRGAAFPDFSVRDLVELQRRLVQETLGIARLHAVVGVSFGGMQAFHWGASHPELVERDVAIVGTPRSTDAERARWQADAARLLERSGASRAWASLRKLEPRRAFGEWSVEPEDFARQARAVASHDVGERGRAAIGSLGKRMLVVLSPTDETVDPKPALELLRASGAELLQLDGRCGHQAPSCERQTLRPAVARFLAGERAH
jgi:homoserine O-acetyltransferase